MSEGVLLSRRSAKRIVVGLATVGAVTMTVQATIGKRPDQIDLRGAMPQNLRPDEYFVGTPWTGEPGIVVSIADLEASTLREPKTAGPIERRREQSGIAERHGKMENPDAPAVAFWPLRAPAAIERDYRRPPAAFTVGTALNAPSCRAGQ